MGRCGLINAFWLKMVMLVLMTGDHLYVYLFPRELLPAHYLARVVAPVFAYLMTQGMLYTRDRKNYISRLFGFGAAMGAVNLVLYFITGSLIDNGIFISLGVGAGLIYCIDKFNELDNRPLRVVHIVLLIVLSIFCEGAYLVPMMALIYYYLRDKPVLMHCVYIALSGLPYLTAYILTGRMDSQFYMIFAFIPIMLYNGKRGPDNIFTKYFFYVYYPLHVWVIFIISWLA